MPITFINLYTIALNKNYGFDTFGVSVSTTPLLK